MVDALILVCTATCILYLTFSTGFILVAIPLIPIAVFAGFKRFRHLLPIAIYTSTIFMSTVPPQGVYLSLPLAIATPFVLRRPGVSKSMFLGPSSTATARYALISLLVVLVSPQVSIPIATLLLSTFGYTLFSYILLSRAYAKILSLSDTVLIDRKASVSIDIYTPITSYVLIDHGFGSNVYVVKGRATIYIEFPAKHTGRNTVDLSVYLSDGWGFASRYVARFSVEYKVVPLVQGIVEAVEKVFLKIQDIEKLLSDVEVAIYNLDLGTVPLSKGRSDKEVANIIREYIRRAKVHSYILKIVERFASILEELSRVRTGGEDVFRRSRWGEYMGVRYYVPGDSIKHIHWKKSASVGAIVVKEFGSSYYERIQSAGEGGLEPIVIVDLYAPNVIDLDRVAFNLVKLCLDTFRRSPTIKMSVYLVVSGMVIGLRGRVIDILYRLYRTFKELPIHSLFNYSSVRRVDEEYVEKIVKLDKKPKPISIYVLSNTVYANRLAEVILREGTTPPKPFTVIHSGSLGLRYAIVRYTFSKYGYIYTPLELVPVVSIKGKRRRPDT